MLTKKKINELFLKLNTKLKAEGVRGEVGIVGGAIMCLVSNVRQATKDIGGIFEPTQKIRKFIKEISIEEGVPEDWLNDGAKGYISGKFNKVNVLALSNLTVWAPQPEYILAMKCISARVDTSDGDDVRWLVRHLKLKAYDDVIELVTKYYPRGQVPAKSQFFIEELFEKKTF